MILFFNITCNIHIQSYPWFHIPNQLIPIHSCGRLFQYVKFLFCRKAKRTKENGINRANPQHEQQLPNDINDENNLVLSGTSGFHSIKEADMGIVVIATPQRSPGTVHYIDGPTITEINDNGIDSFPLHIKGSPNRT